ncbi:MAG: hypothetical protein K5786_02805 [Treponema sp.]|nr:hypothetical protein [Treponema sp.]
MQKYSKLPLAFLKKELKTLEKSYEQFKEIYDYFHSEALGIRNEEIDKKLELPKDNYKYIFIRLYDPVYKDNLPAELLKKGQYLTNTTKIPAAHAAIGFDLSDEFYGLTVGGDYFLKKEVCSEPETCTYFQTCDAKKSFHYTYAIKVRPEEYEAAKEKTLAYYNSQEVKYAVLHNFPVSLYCIKKKMNLPDLPKLPISAEHREFLVNLKKSLRAYKQFKEKDRFVCSTFCSYILLTCIPRIALYFCERDFSYDYITPSELSMLPGMKFLFSGNWLDFKKDAAAFAKENPDFKSYL